jgi:hypothetical protein
MTDEFPHPETLASELPRGNRPEQHGKSLFEQATKLDLLPLNAPGFG